MQQILTTARFGIHQSIYRSDFESKSPSSEVRAVHIISDMKNNLTEPAKQRSSLQIGTSRNEEVETLLEQLDILRKSDLEQHALDSIGQMR